MSLLNFEDLKVDYKTSKGIARAVDGFSLGIDADEVVGLVGESGSGKTTVAKTILRLLPPNGVQSGGRIVFQDKDLAQFSERQMRSVRWNSISMIPQSGMNALDPVKKVGDQIVEVVQLHEGGNRETDIGRVSQLFTAVGLEPNRLDDYPHQFSGGMRQRAMIAMALVLDPWLIIADEPTTGLDVIVQDRILETISMVRRASRKAMLLITHDIALVAENCQRIAVMYAGKIMEVGDCESVLLRPFCPYPMGLGNSFPSIKGPAGKHQISIPGAPPSILSLPNGCRFHTRCPFSTDLCIAEEPHLTSVGPDHLAACHYLDRADKFREMAKDPMVWKKSGVDKRSGEKWLVTNDMEALSGKGGLLQAEDLKKWFPLHTGIKSLVQRSKSQTYLKAVDGVNLRIKQGQILGIAGESGCGKSTIALMLTQLLTPTSGNISLAERSMINASKEEKRAFRRQVQIIFQDPYGSLNPRHTVSRTVLEPLRISRIGDRVTQIERAKDALRLAELTPPEEFWDRFPHQLSGGQKQRVAIARAIVLNPRFIVADEAVSMLDVSVRSGILNLLRRFTQELGLGVLYISHDLSTMRRICDRIAILYLGSIVEEGKAQKITSRPVHPYTRALISAIPVPDPTHERKRVSIEGDIPDPRNLPSGCRFAPRCQIAKSECSAETPTLKYISDDHSVACTRIGETHLSFPKEGVLQELF